MMKWLVLLASLTVFSVGLWMLAALLTDAA